MENNEVRKVRPMETTQTTSEPEENRPQKIPSILIIQHWGEEWVPVLSSDQSNQRSDQPPFSNAYLSGMPSRKRRCIRRSRPPTDLDGFINASLNEVSGSVSDGDASSVRAAFRDHIRRLVRARVALVEAADPERYTNAASFLQSSSEISEAQTARC
ncbi:Large proline-rich protein bag6-A [Papilio xuthus]|uniref:Large proline-rich protein bag6-A n=1 Tax=Papilio xuthus TaxID=66420 RepID=A0A194PRQ3_PAPXU|nr:Large proline-rich protein bag6-A [Papilio xuthus]